MSKEDRELLLTQVCVDCFVQMHGHPDDEWIETKDIDVCLRRIPGKAPQILVHASGQIGDELIVLVNGKPFVAVAEENKFVPQMDPKEFIPPHAPDGSQGAANDNGLTDEVLNFLKTRFNLSRNEVHSYISGCSYDTVYVTSKNAADKISQKVADKIIRGGVCDGMPYGRQHQESENLWRVTC